MADFSSLKQTIQAYIKQNGNEEITGNILQDVLLAMVSTLGDSAINSLASALQDETTERQNQDGILHGNITAEATARQDADTALGGRIDGLQTAINGINTKLAEGYVYAGIATPSTNPGTISGKVFYIAVQAGTYTNLGGTVVTEGITILKYNGTSWVKEQALFTDGGVFDISAYHATGGTLAKYVDLAEALNGGANIPQSLHKGGMSVKFVQSSDNKYVQCRLRKDTFSTNINDWYIEYVSVKKDLVPTDNKAVVITAEGKECKIIDEEAHAHLFGKEMNILKLPFTQIIDGERVYNSGDVVSAPGFWRTNCIPISEGVVLKTAFSRNSYIPFIAFYNSATPSSSSLVSISQGREATVPQGAKYVLIYNVNEAKNGAILCNSEDIPNPAYGMNTYIEPLISQVENLIDIKDQLVIEGIENLFDISHLNRGSIYSNGQFAPSENGYYVSNKIKVTGYDKITVFIKNGLTSTNACSFAADDSISQDVTGTAHQLQYGVVTTFDVPSGANYFVCYVAIEGTSYATLISNGASSQIVEGDIMPPESEKLPYGASPYKLKDIEELVGNKAFDNTLMDKSPINVIKPQRGLAGIIHSWGFIGDSLSSGWLDETNSEHYDLSWGQRMCSLCGVEGYNFSVGGQTAGGWIGNQGYAERRWAGAKNNPKKGYTIALGVNDNAYGVPIGNLSTDIGTYDPSTDTDNNADTFCGNYAGIIQRIQSIAPDAKIFVISLPNQGISNFVLMNEIIEGMCNKFNNVHYVDLYNNAPSFVSGKDIRNKYFDTGHMNAMGYEWFSWLIANYVDWIIRNNMSAFKSFY
jgi:hypothetical protein